MAYTIVGPILKTEKVAIKTALDNSSTSADKILYWESGNNLFFAYE